MRRTPAGGKLIKMSLETESLRSGDAAIVTHNTMGCGRVQSPPLTLPVTIDTPFMLLADVPGDPVAVEGGDTVLTSPVKDKTLPTKNGLQKLNKRRFSMNSGFKHPAGFSKRRRRANSESEPVLPSHFLMGGNIFDPLNLNSLMDEDINRALNAETPKSSPLPAKNREPVEILIPRDITDPLNLSGKGGEASLGVLLSPVKKRRHRYRQHGVPNGVDSDRSKGNVEEAGEPDESPKPYELNTSINCRDEVIPPILPRRRSTNSAPQPESSCSAKHRKRRRTVSRMDPLSITPQIHTDKVRSQTFHTPVVGSGTGSHHAGTSYSRHQSRRRRRRDFHLGIYSRHYGYQTPSDARLAVFRAEWFTGKKVLDIGCNVGHVTLAIAKNWSPAHILGLDIDGGLVHAARQNLRHFLSELQVQEQEGAEPAQMPGRTFPISFRLCRGPVVAPPILPPDTGVFPNNVSFMKGNYVLDSEESVTSQKAEYDVIMCLNVTKWVHLNWGDVGVQRLFRRAYRHLTTGGIFILEAQPWSSYSKRKRLTESTYRNYSSIHLRPDRFSSYLTSEVGFSSYELLSTSKTCPKGLQRPVYLFHKGPASSRK